MSHLRHHPFQLNDQYFSVDQKKTYKTKHKRGKPVHMSDCNIVMYDEGFFLVQKSQTREEIIQFSLCKDQLLLILLFLSLDISHTFFVVCLKILILFLTP